MTSDAQLRQELESKIKKAQKLGVEAVAAQAEAGRQARQGTPKTIDLLEAAYPLLLELREMGLDKAEALFKGKTYFAHSKDKNPKQQDIQWNKPAKENLALPLLKLLLPGASGGMITKCASVLKHAADTSRKPIDFRSWLEGDHCKAGTNTSEKGLTGAYNCIISTKRDAPVPPASDSQKPKETPFDWALHTQELLRHAKSMNKSDLPIDLQPKHQLSLTIVYVDEGMEVCSLVEIPIEEEKLQELMLVASSKLKEAR